MFCSYCSFSFSNFSIFNLILLFTLNFNLSHSFCRGCFSYLTLCGHFLSWLLISGYFYGLTFCSDLFNLLLCWCGLFDSSRSLSFLGSNLSIICWCLFIILNSLPSLKLNKHIFIMVKMISF